MKIGYIGLGKMGLNMVERLLEKKYHLVVHDLNSETMRKVTWDGAQTATSLWELVSLLERPRIIWLMVPHAIVDEVLSEIIPVMHERDVIIDGGNSNYKESIRRAKELTEKGIYFLDAGVSGGPGGARNGACVMVGGREDIYKYYEHLFQDIAAQNAYAYMGESGAGHFVKMVHNGIEYGMMQALAEGFEIMKTSSYKLDLGKIADLYNHRSVIESRLVGWLKDAYAKHGGDLMGISGSTAQSGEGLWTVEVAKELGISVPIIEGAVKFREQSQENPSYSGKVLSSLRNEFGGHDVSNK